MTEQMGMSILSGGLYHATSAWSRAADDLDRCTKLYYPVAGACRLQFGERTFELKPGSLYLISGQNLTRQDCADLFEVYWLHFTPESLTMAHMMEMLDPLHAFDLRHYAFWEPVIRNVVGLFDNPLRDQNRLDADAAPAMHYQVQAMLLFLVSELLRQAPEPPWSHNRALFLKLRPAIGFMERHYAEHPSLEEIARRVHMAPRYFHRRFTELFHITPHAFLVRRRMDKARELLNNTDLRITEIAERLGYTTPFYFSRAFLKHFGRPPSTLRMPGRASA